MTDQSKTTPPGNYKARLKGWRLWKRFLSPVKQ